VPDQAAHGIDRMILPGFDPVAQAGHGDPATAGVVLPRLSLPSDMRFFTPDEEATAIALCDRLLGQDTGPLVPVAAFVDARLAAAETDGWRYADMPEDGQAWRDSLHYLDADAHAKFSRGFAKCAAADQAAVIQSVQDLGSGDWHGLKAANVWSLWTRYACTAFYAHPSAWTEIGFPGPACPPGYKNNGIDGREPFEVREAAAE